MTEKQIKNTINGDKIRTSAYVASIQFGVTYALNLYTPSMIFSTSYNLKAASSLLRQSPISSLLCYHFSLSFPSLGSFSLSIFTHALLFFYSFLCFSLFFRFLFFCFLSVCSFVFRKCLFPPCLLPQFSAQL